LVGHCGKAARLPDLPDPSEVAGTDMPASWGQTTRIAVETMSSFPFMANGADPRFLVGALVIKLSKAFDEKPSAVLSREITRNTQWLLSCTQDEPDEVHDIQARAYESRARALIEAVKGAA
jgi:hypothetical protein